MMNLLFFIEENAEWLSATQIVKAGTFALVSMKSSGIDHDSYDEAGKTQIR
jgi:hypothetical protein